MAHRNLPRHRLVSHLLFAALSGLGAIPWALLLSPWLGPLGAASTFAVVVLPVYLAWIAPEASRALFSSALALVLGTASLVVGVVLGVPSLSLLATASLLAVFRSAFLYRRGLGRAVAVELLLSWCGLLVATLFAAPHPLGLGLGFWTFFLIQSFFNLFGDLESSSAHEPNEDPFEAARRKALEVLDAEAGWQT